MSRDNYLSKQIHNFVDIDFSCIYAIFELFSKASMKRILVWQVGQIQ